MRSLGQSRASCSARSTSTSPHHPSIASASVAFGRCARSCGLSQRSVAVRAGDNGDAAASGTQWWRRLGFGGQQGQEQGAVATLPVKKPAQREAKDVIAAYFAAYNARDLATIASLMAEDVEYHDMIYEQPFVGRAAVVAYLEKVLGILPPDLKFVIEDTTEGDSQKCGIAWHVECGDGVVFPFSRGASFYKLNSAGQIERARDVVEPSMKPGSSTLQILAAVTPLVRKLGRSADANNGAQLPLAAAGVWAFYAAYTSYIMLSTAAPGAPAWQTPPEVLQEVLYESLNFFYVNIGLNAVGIDLVPSVACPPVSEAVFNFVNAWGMMFLPLILTDGRTKKVSNKVAWWAGIMFLTNVFFIPFLALRAAPEPLDLPPSTSSSTPSSTTTPSTSSAAAAAAPHRRGAPAVPPSDPLPAWATAIGTTGLAVGLGSIWWALAARPEYGGLAERWAYFTDAFGSNRVFFAFIVDASLYCLWQSWFLAEAPGGAPYRNVPFFGLVAYLIAGPKQEGQQEGGQEEGQ